MNTIHKYPLDFRSGVQVIEMPRDARVRYIALQNGQAHLWAQVNTDKGMTARRFQMVATGESIPQPSLYCGTWQDGAFVWHLFELLDL